jgi:phosphoglycolate phosphatase
VSSLNKDFMTKIFLFDFDGVIINTLPIAVKVYNRLLKKYNLPIQFSKKTFADLFLNNFHQGLAKIIPDDKLREKILKQRAEEFIRLKNEFEIFKDIKLVLEKLSRKDRIIIISSNGSNYINALLKNNNINCVKEVLGGDIEKSKAKKINWQKQKYPKAEIYYIGDTTGDIIEGKQSEVITVAVTWGFHSKELLAKQKPDYVFDKPNELMLLI